MVSEPQQQNLEKTFKKVDTFQTSLVVRESRIKNSIKNLNFSYKWIYKTT